MDNINAKEMMRGLNLVKKQANNIMNQTFNSDFMSKLTEEQKAEVKALRKNFKALSKSDLSLDSEIFKKFKV